ncbi:gamma-glutamyltransferase 5-like protein [Labeo rohita]|uniref:Gamma-glutamyltransferase 5-like protein n=1 Tax=Labeo rohita TaxID=84645 RepID=A0A498M5X0_LABRO|nr:gamma-glutamyltransferase 5-like protein [Labeo rohita]RXN24508.1 gamma-glutamyltransferase 5-like protein [Labeo rohita]
MCSDVGRDMLLQGGSAVDAAIAALLCTSLVNPQSMGLGGGSIFTIMDKTGNVKIISSRETVPKGVQKDLLYKCPKTTPFALGSHWIGVPGELRGYETAHQLYGKLPWAKLFEPSIKLAREGFPMPAYLAYFLQKDIIKNLVNGTELCELFYKDKTYLHPRDTLKFPKLAETMETIAKEGADAFYTGKIAFDLIQDVQERRFGLSSASNQGDQKTLTLHRFLEAVKFANGQKRNLKDPHVHSRESRDMEYIKDEKFIENIRALITNDSTHGASYYNITPSVDRFGTTHVSVMAADGTAVSVTSTINQMFGSTVYSPKTGIILNNELADFCGRADSVTPGEQPPSSMAPTILQSQKKTLVIGGSGGSYITTAMALSIMNHLWFGMNLTESIAAKIVFVDSSNNVQFEDGYNKADIEAMKKLRHNVKTNTFPFLNVVNGISKEGQCLSAVSDARKKGKSAGY